MKKSSLFEWESFGSQGVLKQAVSGITIKALPN